MDSKMTRIDGCRLLLDVGGTFIKEVLAYADGNFVPGSEDSVPINSDGTESQIRSSLNLALIHARNFASDEGMQIARVAVAIPGPFNFDEGVFLMKHKFASVFGKRFEDIAEAGILPGAKFSFIHDVNCMLLGEMFRGKGRDYDNVALVALGTGLGFTMCVNREILLSPLKSPAVSIFNRPYGEGILEDYVSKRGFLKIYSMLSGTHDESLTVADIGSMAEAGAEPALKTFSEVGSILSGSIRPLMEEYGIQCLLFGGQISRSFRFMEDSVRQGLRGVSTLREISTVSDISSATFNGLISLP